MKKLSYLVPLLLCFVFFGCKYNDSDLWDKVNEHEKRLTEIEKQVKSLNSDISSIEKIVNALNGNDWITSVEELPENAGYKINFHKQSSITINHGTAAPVIGIKQEDGIYYWTLDGEWLLDASGKRMPVCGENGQNGENGKDGVTPLMKVDENTLEWLVSVDNGENWSNTHIVAQGDSFFADVISNDESVVFVLPGGEELEVPRYNAPKITFTGLDENSTFFFPADGSTHELLLAASANIIQVGIASPNPAPAGWSWTVSKEKIEISVQGAFAELKALIVATTSNGDAASYWITLAPTLDDTGDLQDAVNSLANTGGTLNLIAGEYALSSTLQINDEITIRGAGPDQTVLKTDINASSNLQLEDLAVKNLSTNSAIKMEDGTSLIAKNILIEQSEAGMQCGVYTLGDVELYDSKIVLHETSNIFGIRATQGNVLIDGTTIESVNAAANTGNSYGIHVAGENKELTVRNSNVVGFHYPLNLSVNSKKGLVVNVDGSTIQGYCAMNVWCVGGIINVNNSTLIGKNFYSNTGGGTGNDFSIIAINSDNTDSADNNTITVTNSTLKCVREGNALERVLYVGANNNKVYFKGNTTLNDESKMLDYMTLVKTGVTGNDIAAESSVVLKGKDGVALLGN